MRILDHRQRPRVRRSFPLSGHRTDPVLEARRLTAPIFTRIPGTVLEGDATTGNSQRIIVTDPNAVITGDNSGVDAPNPGSGSINEVSSAQANVSAITPPGGGSGATGFDLTSTLDASLQGTIDAGVAGAAAALAGSSSQDGSGHSAALAWTVSDSGGATTGTITATFSLSGSLGADPSTNAMVMELAQLTLTSNQISVFLNTGGVRGLEIIDNTAAGGPKVVYTDPFAGWYRGTPSASPPTEQVYGTSYSTPPITVSLPSVEDVTYTSTLGVGTVNQVGAGQTLEMKPFLEWNFTVS